MEIRTLEVRRSVMGADKYFLEGRARETGSEITQAHLGEFLNAHGMELAAMECGKEVLAELCTAEEEGWQKLKERF